MDEAERCHRLAYIAYGHLLAQGTAQELIAQAGLVTASLTGPDLARIAQALRQNPALNVASFGAALHVSAPTQQQLDEALVPWRGQVQIAPVDTSLEDVFIALMRQTKDNYEA
jgi:ABC-2 type transport system ATP-binding protein